MTIDTMTMLDHAELFQLALNAAAGDDHGAAIAYLKAAAGRETATAATHYLLGAEYAQVGMFDRAAAAMAVAIGIDPALWTARIQLAMLYLSDGLMEKAVAVLQPLRRADAAAAWHAYADGLLRLSEGDLTGASLALADAIVGHPEFSALNRDMQRINDKISGQLGLPVADGEPDDEAGNFFLSAYAGNQTN